MMQAEVLDKNSQKENPLETKSSLEEKNPLETKRSQKIKKIRRISDVFGNLISSPISQKNRSQSIPPSPRNWSQSILPLSQKNRSQSLTDIENKNNKNNRDNSKSEQLHKEPSFLSDEQFQQKKIEKKLTTGASKKLINTKTSNSLSHAEQIKQLTEKVKALESEKDNFKLLEESQNEKKIISENDKNSDDNKNIVEEQQKINLENDEKKSKFWFFVILFSLPLPLFLFLTLLLKKKKRN